MRRWSSNVLTLFVAILLLAACAHPPTSTSTATSTAKAVTNLSVTIEVRQSLLDDAAADHQLPASDYTGLSRI
ncbi:MAG TPA: hypothetical protein VND89_03070 [Acidimicrobiales bacterium]|nr:hypothetical protein [Acidimicrobiales bacterium]